MRAPCYSRHRVDKASPLGISRLLLLLGVVALGACSNALTWQEQERQHQPASDLYVVKKGDTLYGIAWRHGLDHRQLAAWNKLGSGTLIQPGQRIHLRPPTTPTASSRTRPPADSTPKTTTRPRANPPPKAAEPPPRWRWPVAGRVVAEFGSEAANRTGALLAGRRAEPVYAAASGKVVYAGSGLIGYGQLIIIKHNESFLSAYGHNEMLLVGEGDQIAKGQAIAKMGMGPGRLPRLHFEIRKNGNPVNPRQYLPKRPAG